MLQAISGNTKRWGHFSAIASFWEHGAQADFITFMATGLRLEASVDRSGDVIPPKGSQFKQIGK